MELVSVERPVPDATEALVEVEHAGLCGSDAGIFAFKPAFERMELPTIIGHEYTGRVVEVGEEVTSVAVGDRVVERPIRSCGECYQCEMGQANVCPNKRITGVDHDGAYAGYIAVPEGDLHHVPDGVDPRHAALVEPTAITTRAVVEHSRVKPGDCVLVAGPGPMGILSAQVADAQGADVVVAGVDRDRTYRLPLAEKLGYRTINVDTDDLEEHRDELTDGIGYDVVFDTTGHPSGLTMATEEVRTGGQIVLIGQTGETTIDVTPLVRSEIDVQCSYSALYEDFERSFRLISSGDVDLETVLDDRFSLLDSEEAFETFLEGETCKPLFDVSVLRD